MTKFGGERGRNFEEFSIAIVVERELLALICTQIFGMLSKNTISRNWKITNKDMDLFSFRRFLTVLCVFCAPSGHSVHHVIERHKLRRILRWCFTSAREGLEVYLRNQAVIWREVWRPGGRRVGWNDWGSGAKGMVPICLQIKSPSIDPKMFIINILGNLSFSTVVRNQSFAACDWTNDIFHVWIASFAASHWLELICARKFTI